MSKTDYFIPSKIEVSFRKRDDAISGKLGYITYYDKRGNLRCKGSWSSWSDKGLVPESFENKPTSGFMLNKHLTRGGYRFKSEWVRITDPRGFDVEIPVENLIWILDFEGVVKGSKELTGEFVYSWLNGTSLILLPVDSDFYRESYEETTKTISSGIKNKNDLKVGAKYKQEYYGTDVIFVGNFKFMKDYGKRFETVPLFCSESNKNVLYTISSLKNLKYIIQEDAISSDEIDDITKRFNQTAYSKNFWDNLSMISDFYEISDKDRYSDSSKAGGIPYYCWRRSDNPELGDISRTDKETVLTLGKTVLCKDGYYVHSGKITTSVLKVTIDKENSSVSYEILDRLGICCKKSGSYYYAGAIAIDLKNLYPDSRLTAWESIDDRFHSYSSIPGYITVDGYSSDSLYLLARCDCFDKPLKLEKFSI